LLDSILVADNVVDDLKRINKTRVVIKVDYEKAYDSVISANFECFYT